MLGKLRVAWSYVIAARHEISLWAAYVAIVLGFLRLLTHNNVWDGLSWLIVAALLLIARGLSQHDEQLSKLTVVGTAEQLFREAVIAHQARMENEVAVLRSQLDNHIRSTTAGPRRPTPYKR
jgi:hypothetical protein